MDPQHGSLLEVSREASENAALVPQKLIGSRTGICVGIMTNDYCTFQNAPLLMLGLKIVPEEGCGA